MGALILLGINGHNSIANPQPTVTARHRDLVARLRYFLVPWRPVTIVIDGRDGTGKSTLGRFLSWQLGISAIETELLRSDSGNPESHDLHALLRLLMARYAQRHPVIVEGVFVLRALADIGIAPDFLIYLDSEKGGSLWLRRAFEAYEAAYEPRARADIVL